MKTVSRKIAPEEFLASAALICVMGVGFWQACLSLQSSAVAGIPVSLVDFRNGRMTTELSTQLDKNLPIRDELIGWSNAGRYLLVGGAGAEVRLGKDDWLFSAEELQFYPQARRHEEARIMVLSQAASSLKANGVELVVALVPDKSRILHQKLRGGYPRWSSDRYQFIVDSLRRKDVNVVDLQSALTSSTGESAFYYRTDTHWNQAGAKRAALAIASRVTAMVPDLVQTTFTTQSGENQQERVGDLLRMMGLGVMPNWSRPAPDRETPEITRKTESLQTTGLFDDVSMSVVLAGTSYSLRGNFQGHLQQALNTEVLNVARDGGGFIQAIAAYVADEAFQTSKPRVIVWEIPERVFSPSLSELENKGLMF